MISEHEYLFGTAKQGEKKKIIDTRSQMDFPTLQEELNAQKKNASAGGKIQTGPGFGNTNDWGTDPFAQQNKQKSAEVKPTEKKKNKKTKADQFPILPFTEEKKVAKEEPIVKQPEVLKSVVEKEQYPGLGGEEKKEEVKIVQGGAKKGKKKKQVAMTAAELRGGFF